MMDISVVKVRGFVSLCAWERGVIPWLKGRGMTLREAVQFARGAGYAKRVIDTPNLVTTAGKAFIARRITGEETIGLMYMAIGTGTTAPAVSDVKLQTETLRTLLTECVQGDAFFYSSVFLLAADCSIHIKEGGLFGGALATATQDSGSLLCRFALDFDNSVDQYDLTIQHTGEVK